MHDLILARSIEKVHFFVVKIYIYIFSYVRDNVVKYSLFAWSHKPEIQTLIWCHKQIKMMTYN
jgi:hypothetical protein